MYDSGDVVIVQGDFSNDTSRYVMGIQQIKHGVDTFNGCLTHADMVCP